MQSRHDLEVRSWISRVQRLSACAQGAKSSDAKASMSALARLHQEGVPGNAAQSAGAPGGSKQVQGRSASESGHAVCTLDRRARVEHHSASRGGIACHAVRGEGSASGGSFSRASRVLLRVARRQCAGKTGTLLRDAVCRFRSRKKFAFGSAICQLYFFYSRLLILVIVSQKVFPRGDPLHISARTQ